MATIYMRKNGTFQLRIVNKLLPKDVWATFNSYEATVVDAAARHPAQRRE
jgi:hypothetical protein